MPSAAATSWARLPRGRSGLAASIGLDRYGAWCWLLSRAAWRETPDARWGALSPGEVAVSTRGLAEAWGVGHHAARAILSDLVSAGLVEVSRKGVGASGGQVLRVVSGTFPGTFQGTFYNNGDKAFMTTQKQQQGTFPGTFPGRARTRQIPVLEKRIINRSARARAYSNSDTQYTAPADGFDGVRTAPEILALRAGEAEA